MLKKKVWTVFFIIFFISFVVLLALSYYKYQDLYKDYKTNMESLVKVYSKNLEIELTEDEILLDFVGNLLSDKKFQTEREIHYLLADTLKTKPSLVGIGLTAPDGSHLAVSGNLDPKKLPNLLENPATRETFIAALNTDKLVIGKTYYFKPKKAWIIPLRKSVKDKNGKIIGVMATGLKIDDKSFMGSNFLDKKYYLVYVNDKNFYRIFRTSRARLDNNRLYDKPINEKYVNSLFNKAESQINKDIVEIKELQIPISLIEKTYIDNKKSFVSIVFNKKYGYWTSILSPISDFYFIILKSLGVYLVFYLLFVAIIYWLFRTIYLYGEETSKRLTFEATHDNLTGLPNRNYLNHIREDIEKNEEFYVIFMDLDNFKYVNDNYGHTVGDLILIEVAKRLKNVLIGFQNSILLRFGGDEFVVIAFDSEREIAENILKAISEDFVVERLKFKIGVSIGIAQKTDDENIETLLKNADLAMYDAKKNRGTFKFYSENIYVASSRRMLVEQYLRNAIANDEIYMNYQPQFDKDGKFYGVEALARWKNKELGFVPPDEFIGVAEDTGFILELGRHIFNLVFTEMLEVQQELNMNFKVAINVSAKQLIGKDFLQNFLSFVRSANFKFSNIVIELTESVFIEEFKMINNVLNGLKENGVYISLDDFGTGFSTLSLLSKINIDELKIDKSFISNIESDKSNKLLVENILDIANNLHLQVVSEGVENEKQFNILKEMECDIFQGYYFSKPLSLGDLKNLLKNVDFRAK